MKYTVNEAAKIVGTTRQTIYRHIDSKPISVIKDDNGNQLIEASELMRVYGDDIDFDALNSDKPKAATSQKQHNVTQRDIDIPVSFEDKIQLARFEEQIENLKHQLEQKDDEAGYVKKLLEEEKAERKAANNLLEDMRDKENSWQKQFKALEARIANQEKSQQEARERLQKAARINKTLKRKLDEEQKKSFWKRLFG